MVSVVVAVVVAVDRVGRGWARLRRRSRDYGAGASVRLRKVRRRRSSSLYHQRPESARDQPLLVSGGSLVRTVRS